MNSKKFSEAMSEVDNKYVDEAVNYKKKTKKPLWAKWGAAAVCMMAVAVLGTVLFQSGLFGNHMDSVTLENGKKVVFVKSDVSAGRLSLAIDIDARKLSKKEVRSLFGDLPVKAYAIYTSRNMDPGNPQELIGFEGRFGNVEMVISVSDIPLVDTEILGTEETTEINGTGVVAGYCITDPNSRGEQNVIYYAAFEMGNCKVYLENCEDDRETTKNQLAEAIQKLTENGELDLTRYCIR